VETHGVDPGGDPRELNLPPLIRCRQYRILETHAPMAPHPDELEVVTATARGGPLKAEIGFDSPRERQQQKKPR
jgi:hypothetical protein